MSNSSLKLWDFYFSDFTFELPFTNNENPGFWRHYNCLLLYQYMYLEITIPILLLKILLNAGQKISLWIFLSLIYIPQKMHGSKYSVFKLLGIILLCVANPPPRYVPGFICFRLLLPFRDSFILLRFNF